MNPICLHRLAFAALFAPGFALADVSILARPENCSAVMTIQKHGCEVETHLRCDDGKNQEWRVELSDLEGPSSVVRSDMTYNMIEFQSADGDFGVITDLTRSHSVLPSDVIATGKGEIRQIGWVSVFGMKRPISLSADITPETQDVVVSGRKLNRFSAVYTVQFPPPMPVINGAGFVYFDAATGVLFDGEQTFDWPPSEETDIGASPAALMLPGEPGFDQSQPVYDCGELSLNFTDEKAERL